MVAQADKTGTSKNTTNETEKNNDSSTLHINYVALHSQYPLQIKLYI